mmetsp:Transcript_10045/g.16917  ORF Transcript_10045/g.16917 Transcript_10045/m.16917 type:complete len:112 (-) Transcript_10045:503-838(-)
MLPLKPDWLIRPLFYINSPDPKLQMLAQSISVYHCDILLPIMSQESKEGCHVFLKLFPGAAQLIRFIFHFVTSQTSRFGMQSRSSSKQPPLIFTPETQRAFEELGEKLIEY